MAATKKLGIHSAVATGLLILSSDGSGQTSTYSSFVGIWHHEASGVVFHIRKNGDVRLSRHLIGRMTGTIEGGGNFSLEGYGKDGIWKCVYYITTLSDGNRMNWRLVVESGVGRCPSGPLRRISRNSTEF